MGQMVSTAIESVQADSQKQQLANDALNQMQELGHQQINSFMHDVTNNAVNAKLIPVGQILHQESIVRCSISTKPADIDKEIADTFNLFVKGDMAGAISSIVRSGLAAVIGSYEGNRSEKTTYTVTTGVLGGIQRVDIRMFAWKYTSTQLTAITKDMLAVAVIISAVDPKQVTNFAIRSLVQEQFGELPKEEQEKVLKTILAAKKEAHDAGE